MIKLQILNDRNDGCTIHIKELDDVIKAGHFGKILVTLISCYNSLDILKSEIILKADLYSWIENHIDW